MFRTGVALLGEQCCQNTALRRHRVHGVLHHCELARSDSTKRGLATGRDADRVLDLLPFEVQCTTRNNGRDEGRQRGVMPAPLADSRKCCFAEAHLEFVPQHESHDQLFAVTLRALAAGQRGGENV